MPVLHGDFRGQVRQWIVGRGLVGDDVHGKFPGALAAQDLWEYLGGVAYQAYGERLLVFLSVKNQLECFI